MIIVINKLLLQQKDLAFKSNVHFCNGNTTVNMFLMLYRQISKAVFLVRVTSFKHLQIQRSGKCKGDAISCIKKRFENSWVFLWFIHVAQSNLPLYQGFSIGVVYNGNASIMVLSFDDRSIKKLIGDFCAEFTWQPGY